MACILAISSQVARGNVGLSIIVPALQALGHEVMALPTVILSNHPGHSQVAGTQIAPAVLHKMLDALAANGWLDGVDAVLTGYLPTAEHVAFAASCVTRIKTARGVHRVTYLCDPVLGDDPTGLYIGQAAADAIRDQLIPIADIATPNRFELSYLNSKDVQIDVRSAAQALTHHLAYPATFSTSIPSDMPGETLNVLYDFGQQSLTRVAVRPDAPHGTGDLFSALLLSAWLEACLRLSGGEPINIGNEALAFATAGVDAVLAASSGGGELAIPPLHRLRDAKLTWPIEKLGDRSQKGRVILRPASP